MAKKIPTSIKSNKKTSNLFDKIEHYMTVMFELMTMFYFRLATKGVLNPTDEEIAEFRRNAEEKAREDMLNVFEETIKKMK